MTSWLVTGAGGQLATRLVAQLEAIGADVLGLARGELDISSAPDVERVIGTRRPDVVVNAAAYAGVDAAEEDETSAALVNEAGPRLLAGALGRHGGRLVHISTDYVFDGTARHPYGIGDPVGPQGAYGRTKLAGEVAVRAVLPERSHVVRTAWVYGGPGPNFVDTMLRLERERDTIDVVSDQIGSPTWVGDLAAAIVELGTARVPGAVLHFVNAGQASWFELARETFRLAGADPDRVRPVGSDAVARPARRPTWSVLATTSWTDAGLSAPRPWQDALAACFAERA